jgi:shikimate dehydrogenase
VTTPLPISGTTRLYGIVGDPVEQVRSTAVFNAHFVARGLDAVFLPLHVRAAGVKAALAGFAALANLDGLVITIPHKLTFAALVDEMGPHGRLVGAVNAVRRTPAGGWAGELFDGLGFVEGLRGQGIDPAGLSYLIFGAGGAGGAIAGALSGVAPGRIAVTDPVAGRAEALCRQLEAAVPSLAIAPAAADIDPSAFDVVVNATPLGMQADDPLPVDPGRLRPGMLVCEAVMKPPVTRLLSEAERRGCRIQPGRHMLDGQFPLFLDFFGLPR